jgi:hypothetical protein
MLDQTTPWSSYTQASQASERDGLMDRRDELAALVRAQKLELRTALERRRSGGCISSRAMWQMVMAIGQGQRQIAVIDVQLQSLRTS